MEPFEYANIARQEDRHWWYVGMRAISTMLLTQTYGPRNDLRILDAGCGVGGMTAVLSRFGQVTGIDYSPVAMRFAGRRSRLNAGQANVLALPFPADAFDLVTSFDVLYHRSVADIHQALTDTHRVLRRDGRFLIRVPAYNWLRGHHDEVVHTRRRFSAGRLGNLLNETGFNIERLTYANTLLLPLAVARRTAERIIGTTRSAGSAVSDVPDRLNTLFTGVLSAESRWLQAHNLPAGLSVIALAQK